MTADAEARRQAARAALAGPDYAPLWATARKRLEGNGLSLDGTPVRLTELSDEQRRAIAGLLAVSAAGDGPLRVRLATLDLALREGAASIDLIALLQTIGGPVRDRRAERAAASSARQEAWALVEQHAALDRSELATWVSTLRRTGAATRLAGSQEEAGRLVLTALDLLSRLPAQNVPLAVLAADTTGDAHSLDRGRPLGTLIAGALAVLDSEEDDEEWTRSDWPTAGAYWWRRRWARAGVMCDDLSVSVLALNLPVTSSGDIIAGSIYEHAQAGEPLRLTLRQLAIGEIEVKPGATVHVCENPSVVAQAAALLEGRSAPLVCAEGQPNSAVHALLDLLVRGGSLTRYHGDFDWDGLRIGGTLMARYGSEPWRFCLADYMEAVPLGRLSLQEPRMPINTPWSPGLREAMSAERVAIHEEQVLTSLIEDLSKDGQQLTR